MKQDRVCAIILAAGSGRRMNLDLTKQQLSIKGKSVIYRSAEAFEECEDITDIILVVKDDEMDFATHELSSKISKLRKIVTGGKTRVESARLGFQAIDFPCRLVAIHDAARCLILPNMITKVVNDATLYRAATASSVVVDTVKRIDKDGFIISTENREELRLASTPQIFDYELYKKAISSNYSQNPDITDDNMLMERMGIKVHMTDVGGENIKITYAEDIAFAEYLLERRDG